MVYYCMIISQFSTLLQNEMGKISRENFVEKMLEFVVGTYRSVLCPE